MSIKNKKTRPVLSRSSVTQKQIAEYLQMSQQTVSAAFNNSQGTSKVGEKKRRLILETAQKLGHIPNQLARSFRMGKTRTIGVLMPYCNDPYYAQLIDAISREAFTRDYAISMEFHLHSKAQETAALERLLAMKVEGILLYPTGKGYHHKNRLSQIAKQNDQPIVALNTPSEEKGFFDGILKKDYVREGFLLGEALIRKRIWKIDYLSVSPGGRAVQQKFKGIQDAAVKARTKIAIREISLPPALRKEEKCTPAPLNETKKALQRLVDYYVQQVLSHSRPKKAMFTGNETTAILTAFTAMKQGWKIPNDFLIACGSISGGGYAGLPMIRLRYDSEEIAQTALDLLLNHKKSNSSLRPTLIDQTL